MASGGYESISKQVFRRAKNYDIFLLEYDSPRAGSFEPLADLPPDKRVVLGLVSTKTDQLESGEELLARIGEAARFFPRDQNHRAAGGGPRRRFAADERPRPAGQRQFASQ